MPANIGNVEFGQLNVWIVTSCIVKLEPTDFYLLFDVRILNINIPNNIIEFTAEELNGTLLTVHWVEGLNLG